METIGERIKNMRLEKDWTQKDLAKALGLKNDTAIANYEANYSIPKDEIKYKLCNTFNCTMDYLMGKSYYKNYEEFEKIDKFVLNYQRSPQETKIICDALNYINKHQNISFEEVIDKFTNGLPSDKTDILKSIIRHLHYRYHGKLPQSNIKKDTISINKIPILRYSKG